MHFRANDDLALTALPRPPYRGKRITFYRSSLVSRYCAALIVGSWLCFIPPAAQANDPVVAAGAVPAREISTPAFAAKPVSYPFGYHGAYRYPYSYRYYSYGPRHYPFGNGPYGPYGSNYGGYTGNRYTPYGYGYGGGYGSPYGYGYGYATPDYANPGWNWYGTGTYGYGSYGMPGSYAYGYDPLYSGQWQYNSGYTGAYGYGSAYGYPYTYPGYYGSSPYLSIYGSYGAPWYGYSAGNYGWGYSWGW
jgi:hypothetical protein